MDDKNMNFGMEENPSEKETKIKKYTTEDISPAPDTSDQTKVDPTAEAPENPKAEPAAPLQDAAIKSTVKKSKKPTYDPVARKKAVLGCLGAFGAMMLILLVLSFVFLAISDAGASPIAQLLGINHASFVNGLITFIHLIFILVSLTAFVFTMVGLFKASMAKKDDIVARKSGLKMSIVAGGTLLAVLIIWMFTYIYLDSKRVPTDGDTLSQIVTEPEETLNLTAPIEVKFDASNIKTDARKFQIVSYDWDFGDGETGTNQITSHVYTEKGTFTAMLTITVKDVSTGELLEGGKFTEIISVANQALTAIFTADPQTGTAPLEVKFDASDSVDPDGILERYEWDFDEDGSFDDGEGVEIEHTFNKIGIYTVELRVTSTTGEYDVYEKDIIVEEALGPEAVIKITNEPEEFFPEEEYIFKAEDSTSPNGKIVSYEWDFGDGTPVEKTKTVAHTFKKAGSYEVVLLVTDEEETEGEAEMLIIVGVPQGTPEAVITTNPAMEEGDIKLTGRVPFGIEFDASASTDSDNNIVEYEWDFDGDGATDSFKVSDTYTYMEEGTYTVTLKVTDADDNVGTKTLGVEVEEQGITAIMNASPIDGSVPLEVSFDASASTYQNGQITSYQWDFGDNTSPKIGSSSITHRYKEIGTFTATVTVVGSDNTMDTDEVIVTVREIPLTACFVSIFEEGSAPLETEFDPGCSTGTVSSYFWDFGDGSTSTAVKPTHTFQEAGEYKVILEISDADSNISKAELYITVTE